MRQTMRALNLPEPNHFVWEERPVPDCPPGYALLKMEALGVCGSDIHAYAGHQPYFSYPRVLGHEICARIESINDPGSSLSINDRVVVVPYIPCGKCAACKHGKPNACIEISTFGVHVDGGLMEYVAVPTDALIRVSELEYPPQLLAMIEPFAIGAHAAARSGAASSDCVLVVGAGPIGIAAAEMLKTKQARVCIAETNGARAQFAMDRFGFPVFSPLDEAFPERLREFCGGESADIVIDATGNKRSMDSSYRYIRAGGRVVFVGLFNGSFEINDPYFHLRESELLISRTATHADFSSVIHAMQNHRISVEPYLSHSGSFADAAELLPDWIARGTEVFKAALVF